MPVLITLSSPPPCPTFQRSTTRHSGRVLLQGSARTTGLISSVSQCLLLPATHIAPFRLSSQPIEGFFLASQVPQSSLLFRFFFSFCPDTLHSTFSCVSDRLAR